MIALPPRSFSPAVIWLLFLWGMVPRASVFAQRGEFEPPAVRATSLDVEPARLVLEIGETARLEATPRDADGNPVAAPAIFLSSSRRHLDVTTNGEVEALAAGEFTIIVRVPSPRNAPVDGREAGRLTRQVRVTVLPAPVARIEIEDLPDVLYAGSTVPVEVSVYDQLEKERFDVDVRFESLQPRVATVDRFGMVHSIREGDATLRVTAEDARGSTPVVEDYELHVAENPIVSLEILPPDLDLRTGDVASFRVRLLDRNQNVIDGVPVLFSVRSYPDPEDPARPASAEVTRDGRFVAELPGRYRVVATGGGLSATATVAVAARNVRRSVRVVGRGPVRDRHTSDLWLWASPGGGDYAMTGTWQADGEAYVWDVTDPADIQLVDRIQVDARTVNDVKVSQDGTLAVISREGASSRRNGIVLLDVSDPRDVVQVSSFSEELTGGVHNTFIHDNHVYALSNGRRFDIINVAEPGRPFRVGRFELDSPAHSIHDVWVEDGIAYSSNWQDGVVLIDVGNGIAGGRPDHPVRFAQYRDPLGRTHAAFPFHSQSTGKFYVVMGDEFFPSGINPEGPTIAGGYMHFVDFTDPGHPVEVARFEVPEAGSHNIWIEDDVLYAAFYNGGLRIVDLSGELMGDLYRQGREIASFQPKDGDGYVPNETMVWGAQPHKDIIYVADWNSGLWAIQLGDPD